MAESSIIVYILVLFVTIVFALLLQKLYHRRLRAEGRPHGIIFITHPTQNTIGIMLILISFPFFVGANMIFTFVDLLDEYIEKVVKQEKPFYDDNTEIDFRDHEPDKTWIKDASITSSDSDPLIIGKERGLQVTVDSDVLPKSLVVHIFHEDMMDFFMNEEDPTAYRQQTERENRTLGLQYGPMFSIEFDLSKHENCIVENSSQIQCEYSFQQYGEWAFDTPGKYFVIFSAQLQNGEFDHKKSPLRLTTIMEPHDVWIEDQTLELKISSANQNKDTKYSLALTYLAIGTGIFLTGLAMIIKTFEWRQNNLLTIN